MVRLNIYNFRVRDISVRPVYNIGEKSGIKPIRMIPKLAWLLLKLFFYRMLQKYVIRDFHPLLLFFVFGFVALFSGIAIGSYLVFDKLFLGGYGVTASRSVLAALFLLSGLQFILFAMFFDMQESK